MPSFGVKYVLTSPEKVFHNVEKVVELCLKKNFISFFVVKEYGENSDNPHLNVAIQVGEQSFKNMLRDLKKAYYGDKINDFENIEGFKQHGVKSGGIPNEQGYKYFANYLKKELSRDVNPAEIVKQHNCDIFELTKDMAEYDAEACAAKAQLRKEVKSVKDDIIQQLVDVHNEMELGKPTKYTFNMCCCTLAKKDKNVNLKPLLNRVAIFYILYANSLGDTYALQSYINNALSDFEPVSHTQF